MPDRDLEQLRRYPNTRVTVRRFTNERPYILSPIGDPAADAVVPELARRSQEELAVRDPGVEGAAPGDERHD